MSRAPVALRTPKPRARPDSATRDQRGRARRGPLALAALAALLLLAFVVTAGALWGGSRRTTTTPPSAGPTATVERRTLVERESVDGTLGYSGSRTLVNRLTGSSGAAGAGDSRRGGSGAGRPGAAAGSGSGAGGSGQQSSATLTGLARPGSVVRRGGVLYEVDDKPVVLMYGSLPAYRSLRRGVADGSDVRQLETNLAALGFGAGVKVDDHYSAATAAAVRRWQRSMGLRATGAVELGRIVFLPGERRVGAPAGRASEPPSRREPRSCRRAPHDGS